MRGRVTWLLTVLAVVGVCAPTMGRGWDFMRYERAEMTPEALRPWFDVPGVAFASRDYALPEIDVSDDSQKARERRENVTDILTIRPLSSEYWLSLAKLRQFTGEPSGKVLEALTLSALTGPNEDYMLAGRGVFGVSQWENLPAEFRERAAADLTATPLSDRNATLLRENLAQKSQTTRQEIRLALQAHGLAAAQLSRLGL